MIEQILNKELREANLKAYEDESFNEFTPNNILSTSNKLKIAFIGNSLTLHGPAPAIGWNNDCGMAASNTNTDFAHLLASKLGLIDNDIFVGNFTELERVDIRNNNEQFTLLKEVFDKKPVITIIQLGDNISDNEQLQHFQNNLQLLMPDIKNKSSNIFLLSTWWENAVKDFIIKNICDSFQTHYIYR